MVLQVKCGGYLAGHDFYLWMRTCGQAVLEALDPATTLELAPDFVFFWEVRCPEANVV